MAHIPLSVKAQSIRGATTRLAAVFALAFTLPACGGTEPGDGNGNGNPATGALLPMATGISWEYRVTDAGTGQVTQKRTTVGGMEAIGGTGPFAAQMALKVTTRKGPSLTDAATLDKTESWQGPQPGVPERIVRYRELSYDATTQALELEEFWEPARIHIDGTAERTAQGAAWVESYKESKVPVVGAPLLGAPRSDAWSVISADVAIQVLGTTYEHAVHFKKADKEYWYVRGIGKVKEIGGQTEELVEYNSGNTP